MLRRKVFKFEKVLLDESVNICGKKLKLEPTIEGTTIHKPQIEFNRDLLKVLACPLTGKSLEYDHERNVLISKEINFMFPINTAGMPLLLSKWAIPLDEK